MNFYRLKYTPPGAGLPGALPGVEWFTSERDAVRRRIILMQNGTVRTRKDATIKLFEIPTRRADLLIWLNEYMAGGV